MLKPMPQRVELRWQEAQKAEMEHWERWRALRARVRPQLEDYWQWYITLVNRYVSFEADHRILDIGCGPDGMINYIPVGHRFGLDPLVDSYRTIFDMDPDVTWKIGRIEEIPFDDRSFDIVVSTNALDHTRDPMRGLGEIHRVLKPTGSLILTVNCYPPFRRLVRVLRERLGKGDRPHPYNYSKAQVYKLMTRADFRIIAEEMGIGTLGAHFPEQPTESADAIHRAANLIFMWEARLFGYSCIDFLFIGRKTEQRA